jgi:cysteinyl-tRNA synthetase
MRTFRNTYIPALMLCLVAIAGCKKSSDTYTPSDYRQEMRDFVQAISSYAKAEKPGFLVVPQNGQELITTDGKADSTSAVVSNYVGAIDGQARESLIYGYPTANERTSTADSAVFGATLQLALAKHLAVLTVDYCSDPAKVDSAYDTNHVHAYIPFVANHTALDNVPAYPSAPVYENSGNIDSLSDAKNWLYLTNQQAYGSKQALLTALAATNYDVVVMDLYYNNTDAFTASEIAQLRNKANGGKRLVLAYMNVGEADNSRYYWQSTWNSSKPNWLLDADSQHSNQYYVQYWQPQWQQIMYGNDGAYTKKIIDAGFDGAYLDGVAAYSHFE